MKTLLREWEAVASLPSDAEAVENFRQRLRAVVCRDYGWLASELFEIEGELGWGPGIREYDGEFFPPRTPSSTALMQTFLNTLTRARKDTELTEMIRLARLGVTKDKATALLAVSLAAKEVDWHKLIHHFYGRVSELRDTYTLGAARMYLALWTQQHNFAVAVAGLIRLLVKPLSKLWVRAETVRRKFSHTSFDIQPQPVDAVTLLQAVS